MSAGPVQESAVIICWLRAWNRNLENSRLIV
jgi:hypothetical protein